MNPQFSNTTHVENIALQVTVMDACQKFFVYGMGTCCGFPSVTLEGSEQDWRKLRESAANIVNKRCTKAFSQWWLNSLLPLLDKIIEEYCNGKKGLKADDCFWNSMMKVGGTEGSGE